MASSDTQKKLLDAAESILLSEGYLRTSVDAVCEKAGMTKGSLYHHYKTKEDLAIAVLERWLMGNARILTEGPHTSGGDPVEAALAYIDHVADSTERLWKDGCLVGSLSMELSASSDRMQQCVEKIFKGFVAHHAEIFAPLLARSASKDTPSAHDFAEMFVSLIEGAIVLGKSYRDPKPLIRSIRSFGQYARHIAGTSALKSAAPA